MKHKKTLLTLTIIVYILIASIPLLKIGYSVLWYGSLSEAGKATLQEFILSGGGFTSSAPQETLYIGVTWPSEYGLPNDTTFYNVEMIAGQKIYMESNGAKKLITYKDDEAFTFCGWTYAVKSREKKNLFREEVQIAFYPTEGAVDEIIFSSDKPFYLRAINKKNAVINYMEAKKMKLVLSEGKIEYLED